MTVFAKCIIIMGCCLSGLFWAAPVLAEVLERPQVAEQYKWNLADLYPSLDAWQAHKAELEKRVAGISGYQGKLAQDAATLLAALTESFAIDKELNKLYVYASLLADEDARISANQELVQAADNLWTVFEENRAYFEPELVRIEPERIAQYLQEKPELADFSMHLADIQRKRAHTLSEAEEKILASTGDITGAAETVFGIFDDAEMPRPQVTVSTGETVEMGYAGYYQYRASDVRENRQKAMQAFLAQYGAFENTIGANLVAALKNDYFYAKTRKYASCLEAALYEDNVPVSLYANLITQIHNSLPTLHRFLQLKKRMLGVEELHYYDLYASIVKDVNVTYTVEQGQEILLAAFAPLGQEYADALKQSFTQRWIDYLPNQGKASGGYSGGGAYRVHPYILLNWIDDYDSLSTLAHETGHSLHDVFSQRNQPYPKAYPAIFVAEIASTLNENLLTEYLIAHTDDREQKLALLGNYSEVLRTTIFRQVLFAEFEWEIHKKIENGEPLSGESLSELYLNLVKRYYGHDQGVCLVEPEVAYEWAYVSHFYLNFYVYKYATSLIYSTALTQKIVQEGQPAVEKYFTLLKGGNSQYPTDLAQAAGIDPFAAEPFELTMQRMNSIMDQIEALLDK